MKFTIFPKPINCIATTFALTLCAAFLCNSALGQEIKTQKYPVPKICTGGIINSKVILEAKPHYTQAAQKARAEGEVIVMVRVDEKGNVYEASACTGHKLLRQSAVNAAYRTKIALTKLSGQAVKFAGILLYKFKIEEEKGGLVEIKPRTTQ
jgi:TonB family protein